MSVKRLVHPKTTNSSSFTHPHAVPRLLMGTGAFKL